MLIFLALLINQVGEFESVDHFERHINPLNDVYIDAINSLNTTWKVCTIMKYLIHILFRKRKPHQMGNIKYSFIFFFSGWS